MATDITKALDAFIRLFGSFSLSSRVINVADDLADGVILFEVLNVMFVQLSHIDYGCLTIIQRPKLF